MATSRIPAVIDALLAVLTGAITAPRRVVDGPEVSSGSDSGDVVFVGWNGDLGDFTAADTVQEWRGLGAGRKDETISVRCSVVVWSGDQTIKPLRDAAFATFALAETALRADASLGLPSPAVAAVVEGELVQEPGRARLPFTVTVSNARI